MPEDKEVFLDLSGICQFHVTGESGVLWLVDTGLPLSKGKLHLRSSTVLWCFSVGWAHVWRKMCCGSRGGLHGEGQAWDLGTPVQNILIVKVHPRLN